MFASKGGERERQLSRHWQLAAASSAESIRLILSPASQLPKALHFPQTRSYFLPAQRPAQHTRAFFLKFGA